MAETLMALKVLAAMVAVAVFWAVVIFVIPAYIALVVASWLPLTGQWRKRGAGRRGNKGGARRSAAAKRKTAARGAKKR